MRSSTKHSFFDKKGTFIMYSAHRKGVQSTDFFCCARHNLYRFPLKHWHQTIDRCYVVSYRKSVFYCVVNNLYIIYPIIFLLLQTDLIYAIFIRWIIGPPAIEHITARSISKNQKISSLWFLEGHWKISSLYTIVSSRTWDLCFPILLA